MALDKKRAPKRSKKSSETPIVETVLDELTYTTSTSAIVDGGLRDGEGSSSANNDVKGKRKVYQRGKRSTVAPTAATTSGIGSDINNTHSQNHLNSMITSQTKGQTDNNSNSANSRKSYSSKTTDSRYFEEEAEEGEEDDNDDEDDEGEYYEDDEEDNGELGTETQYLQKNVKGSNCYGMDFAEEGINAVNGSAVGNYHSDQQDEHAYAISVDHNIVNHNTVRPPIGKVVASKDFYKRLAKNQTPSEPTGLYAPSFSPPRCNSSGGSGSSTLLPSPTILQQSSISGSNKVDSRISSSTGIHATLSLNAEGSIKFNSSSSSFGVGNTSSQLGTTTNLPSTNQKMYLSSPSQMSQHSQMQSSTPISLNASKEPLRPKLIAHYTVAMNALESVTTENQTKLGYEQANTAINSLLNESTSYYKAVYMGEIIALKPPSSAKDSFADSILKSGNLLGEYKVMFREYEAATTSQSLASAQLKHALAQKQLIESKLLHIKNRLHQLQFDAGR